MANFSLILRMPDQPGALHRGAEIIKKHDGNITRVSYDRNIDPGTVFFEVSAPDDAEKEIREALESIGYLQTTLRTVNYLKFCVELNHRPGALYDFLNYITDSGANIAMLDFDEKSQNRVILSLTLEDKEAIKNLLDKIMGKYKVEILKYDTSGTRLDETVYYFRVAQEIREITGQEGEAFLMQMLQDINRITQDLARSGEEPGKVLESIIATGKSLKETTGEGFYADIQRIGLRKGAVLYCIQMPCGGNVYVIDSPKEAVLIDSGYGIYHKDLLILLLKYAKILPEKIKRVYLTHADSGHAGAAGLFNAHVFAHPTTKDIIEKADRGVTTEVNGMIAREIYGKLINLFSKFTPPKEYVLYNTDPKGIEGIFPVIATTDIGGIKFKVLQGIGGHIQGQVFLYSQDPPILFAGDSVINLIDLTEERKSYILHTKNLIPSLDINRDKAEEERRALLKLAEHTSPNTLICCGHGPISVQKRSRLEPYGEIERYPKTQSK